MLGSFSNNLEPYFGSLIYRTKLWLKICSSFVCEDLFFTFLVYLIQDMKNFTFFKSIDILSTLKIMDSDVLRSFSFHQDLVNVFLCA